MTLQVTETTPRRGGRPVTRPTGPMWALCIVIYATGVTTAVVGLVVLLVSVPGDRTIGPAWAAIAAGTFAAVLVRAVIATLSGRWQ